MTTEYYAYITTSEAAKYLCMSRRTLETLRVRGGGPEFHKLGRLVRYKIDDLEAWAKSGRRTSTSDHGEAA